MSKIKLPKRRPESHKGTYGKVLVIAGSPGMTGAAVLCSRGALRVGAGLVYLALPRDLVNFVDTMTPEVITLPFEKIKTTATDAIAVGPGLGTSSYINKLIHSLVISNCLSRAESRGSLVIDADGLNAIAKNPSILKDKDENKVIITPHPGEMSRLMGKSIQDIQKNRTAVAKEAARRFRCIVVLKGHRTVVADESGKVYINPTGNPGMASAGVGDVLTGIIAGLIAQGLPLWDAAVSAVFLHGRAGDLAAKEKGYGLIASDLVERIPYALQNLC